MLKNILGIIICVMCLFAFCGCSDNDEYNAEEELQKQEEEAALYFDLAAAWEFFADHYDVETADYAKQLIVDALADTECTYVGEGEIIQIAGIEGYNYEHPIYDVLEEEYGENTARYGLDACIIDSVQ